MPTCLAYLCPHMSMCLRYLHAHVPVWLVYLSNHVPYMLTCQPRSFVCLCTHMSSCLARLSAHVPTCLESLASLGLHDHVITCQHACLLSESLSSVSLPLVSKLYILFVMLNNLINGFLQWGEFIYNPSLLLIICKLRKSDNTREAC